MDVDLTQVKHYVNMFRQLTATISQVKNETDSWTKHRAQRTHDKMNRCAPPPPNFKVEDISWHQLAKLFPFRRPPKNSENEINIEIEGVEGGEPDICNTECLL